MLGRVRYFVLDDDNSLRQVNALAWAVWFETAGERAGFGGCGLRQVAYDKLPFAEVSTVFVGIDISLTYGPAVGVFETMTFSDDGQIASGPTRFDTWEEAAAAHARTVAALKALQPESTVDGRTIYR